MSRIYVPMFCFIQEMILRKHGYGRDITVIPAEFDDRNRMMYYWYAAYVLKKS